MDALLLMSRLIVAGVLATSGALKLANRDGTRETLRAFGFPDWATRPTVWTLPAAEMTVGLLICVPATARPASAAAAALLAGSTVLVWRLVAHGAAVACHCFGALSSQPVNYRTLLRNLPLLALALLGASSRVNGYWTSWQWVRDASPATTISLVLSTVALGGVGWLAVLTLQLMRRNGELLLQAAAPAGPVPITPQQTHPGPLPGAAAPAFELTDAEGESWTLDRLGEPDHHLAVVSVDPNCGPCRALLPELSDWLGRNDGSPLDVVLLSRDAAATAAECRSHGLHVPVLSADPQTLAAYGLSATPTVVLIGVDQRIKAGPAGGGPAILKLLERFVSTPDAFEGPAFPTYAPAQLPAELPALPVADVEGRQVLLPSAMRRRTVLVFWRSTCGFCQRIVGDIEAWSAQSVDEPAVGVAVVAPDEATRRQFSSTVQVFIDPESSVSRAVGAMGTPSAVVVDVDGSLVSTLAAGQGNVLNLMRAELGGIKGPQPVLQIAELEVK